MFFLSSADDGLVTGLPEPVARLPGEEAEEAEEAHQGGQTPGAQHCDHTQLRSVRSLL